MSHRFGLTGLSNTSRTFFYSLFCWIIVCHKLRFFEQFRDSFIHANFLSEQIDHGNFLSELNGLIKVAQFGIVAVSVYYHETLNCPAWLKHEHHLSKYFVVV